MDPIARKDTTTPLNIYHLRTAYLFALEIYSNFVSFADFIDLPFAHIFCTRSTSVVHRESTHQNDIKIP